MVAVLLVSGGESSVFHTPRLTELLKKEGVQVSIAANPWLSDYYITMTTGFLPVDMEKNSDFSRYDAAIFAPCEKMDAIAKVSGIPVIAAAGEKADKHNSPENVVQLPANASPELCLETLLNILGPRDFEGKTLLLTAGPTIEDADPARYISNRSTGKMGTAIARAAARRGARVILIHGPMSAPVPEAPGIIPVPVRSAYEMMDRVSDYVKESDFAILCAAVADFAPVQYSEEKIKKGKSQFFDLMMCRTPDILAAVGAMPDKPFLVGFAAESCDVKDNAMDKLIRKNCDMLCANDITAPGCGFATETNRLIVFSKNGNTAEIPLAEKIQVANKLLDMIHDEMNQ